MQILVTILGMGGRSGTQVVVEQLVDGLRRAGHVSAVYTSRAGPLAEQMRYRGHIVVDRLSAVPFRPDVIHGNHTMTTMAALAAFPGVPAVFVCHDATVSWDHAPVHPQIRKWFAVDKLCRARLIADGIEENRIELLLNTVDLQRHPRRARLPRRPKRGLVLTKMPDHIDMIRGVCEKQKVKVDALGPGAGVTVDSLGDVLPEYDLVFATARMALEAAASGCAVVVCDDRGCAGFLSPENWRQWRSWNLGRGVLKDHTNSENIERGVAAYSRSLAHQTTDMVRSEASVDRQVQLLEAAYADAIEAPTPCAKDASQCLATFIEDCVPSFRKDAFWKRIVSDIATGGRKPPDTSPVQDVRD